jgi:hypothetical protein
MKTHDPHTLSQIYALFKAFMTKHWACNFFDVGSFKNLTKQSGLTMEIIRKRDAGYRDLIERNLDGVPLGFLILPVYLLWMKPEVFGKGLSAAESIARLLSLWTTLLCFPDPNRAVAMMVAAMLLKETERVGRLVQHSPGAIIQLFLGSTEWDFKEITNMCIQLY